MRTLSVLAVTAAGLLILTGCANEAHTPPSPAAAASGVSLADALTDAQPVRVSHATVCPELIQHGQAGVDLVLEFTRDPQAMAEGRETTTARFDAVINDLKWDSQVAPERLVPFIDAQVETLEGVRDYLQVGGSRDNDFREFRSSGVEIANQCMGLS